jgi:hypothetical protein
MAFTPPHGFWDAPPAYMGFVGFIRINAGTIKGNPDGISDEPHDSYIVRATSADINLTQAIEKPDVIDSRYDKTVYQLGPKLVDGSFAFPAVYEVPEGQTMTLFEALYRYAVTRNEFGGLTPFEVDVKYAASNTLPNEAEFRYTGCIANTWQFSVAQSEVVSCSVDVLGVNRETLGKMNPPERSDQGDADACTGSSTVPFPPENKPLGSFGTTRIVTWNDARVEMRVGEEAVIADDNILIGGEYIRSFECNINNDAERFYTLNTKLFAQAISPRKREITGNITLLGRYKALGDWANSNQKRCNEASQIKFGFSTPGTGYGCAEAPFNVLMPNCVFEIEEMSLTNDLFETTVNWHALPAAGTGVCDPMLSNIGGNTFEYESRANDTD